MKSANQQPDEEEAWEGNLAQCIYFVEKECSQRIMRDYPLFKFYSLLEYLAEDKKREQSELDKLKRK